MKLNKKILLATSAFVMLPVMAVSFATDASAATKAKAKAKAKAPAAAAPAVAAPAAAAPADPFADFTPGSFGHALVKGTPWIDARYRYENVDQEGGIITDEAFASVLRTRIGYKTGVWNGFQVAGEGENIKALGADHYNSTTNGKTQFPIVSDPEDTLLNQLYISYQGLPKTNITVGRQRIVLDNHRFVGDVGWRQNDQTFDAASISTQFIDKASIYYAYLRKVNRITGPSATNGAYESDSHIVNASYEFIPELKLTAYDYALDFNDAASSSSNTYGIRATGKYAVNSDINLIYAAEYARQSDYGSNTVNYDANYYLIEPGVTWNGFTAKLGYEVLEGDGTATHAFQTPLATLHAFNGWADKFLTTPANGLEDRYVSVGYKVPFGDKLIKGTDLVVAYHDFQADHTNSDYGTEWNASIQQTFYDHFTLGLKYADYQADDLNTDTTKVIATVQIKY
jgi:hypothetical protein